MKKLAIKLTLATLIVAGLSTAVYALPKDEVDTTYYNNASHSAVVGVLVYDCTGHIERWGQTTSFHTQFTYPCH